MRKKPISEMTNFCDSIKKYSPEFKRMVYNTEKNETERGVCICAKDDNTTLSNECIGELCIGGSYIPAKNWASSTCKEGERSIGHFHTHPSRIGGMHIPEGIISDLSTEDVLTSLLSGDKFSCIGYMDNKKNEKIVCYRHPYGISKKLANDFENVLTEFNRDIDRTHQKSISKEQIKNLADRRKLIIENFVTPVRSMANRKSTKELRNKDSCKFLL